MSVQYNLNSNLCFRAFGSFEVFELKQQTDYCLIETGEREDLCDFIQEAAIIAGLTDTKIDITEEWREW